MNKLFALSMFLHKAALIFLAIVFLVFFLATGHGINFSDSEQMKFFLFQLLFIIASIFLISFKRDRAVSAQRFVYVSSVLCLFGVLLGMIYIAKEMFEVKYGNNRPYFIFLVLFFGIANSLFLLFVFLFKRDTLFQKKDEQNLQ